MKQNLIIIRGAPASGKSTISESLRDFDKKIVWFNTDNIKDFFSVPSEARILDDVMETCVATLSNLLDRGYSVVYEGIFKNPDYALTAIELGKSKNIPTIVYQLSSSLKTLQERDKKRAGVKEGLRKPMEDSVIESLYNKVENNALEGAIKLDTEKKSVQECIEIIKSNFN